MRLRCATRLERAARRNHQWVIRAHRAGAHFERSLAMTDLLVNATSCTIDLGQRLQSSRDGEIVRQLQLLANLQRAARECLAAVVVLLMQTDLRETRQNRRDLRMARAECLLLDRQQPLEQRSRRRVLVPPEIQSREIVQRDCDIGMCLAEMLLADRERALEERLRLIELISRVVERREVVDVLHEAEVLGSEHTLADRECTVKERFCLREILLLVFELAEIAQARCQANVVRAELRRFADGREKRLLCPGKIAVREREAPRLVLLFPPRFNRVVHAPSHHKTRRGVRCNRLSTARSAHESMRQFTLLRFLFG